MKIGIPGSMLYYSYYPLWKNFFENLGVEVVTSGDTNKKILELGLKLCVDEACLPVKIYHGHVKSLCDKVDAIFTPRIISIHKNEYICPKFCGMPEMIKNSVPGLPYMIESIINLRKGRSSIYDSMIDAASIITKNSSVIRNALGRALSKQRIFEHRLKRSGDFNLSLKDGDIGLHMRSRKTIAVLGHPYNIYDKFANMNMINKIKSFGYDVVTPEMMDTDRIDKSASILPKRHFWTFGRIILGAGISFVENRDVDGIIYLSSFGCGIDSMMEDYLERKIRRDGKIPYMKLVLDEHTGEAGMDTRLEAFIDMVNWRDEDEGNISPYGRGICSS